MPSAASRTLAVLLSLSASLSAQQVTASIETANNCQAQANSMGWNEIQTVPAGTVGFNVLLPQTPAALVDSRWLNHFGTLEAGCRWHQSVEVFSPAPAFAKTNLNELLLRLTATAQTPVTIELSRSVSFSPGAIAPDFGIDFGDDGTFDLVETSPALIAFGAVLGPQTVDVRLRSRLSQTGVGSIALDLEVRVVPHNSLVILPAVLPCGPAEVHVLPTFAGQGVECFSFLVTPTVLVLGLQLQPVSLPPLPSGTSCTLLPSPDLLSFAPPGQPLTVPLPASARPLTLWIQGVGVTANGFASSNAFGVTAW